MGDEYQDLQSAEILLEWLEQPDAYLGVRLESMDGALDDIQVQISDGSYRFLQVKFATDPTDELSWEQLTRRESGIRGPRSSLLQKWRSSLVEAEASGLRISEAALITNRSAHESIRTLLSPTGHVDISNLPESQSTMLAEQLGGDGAARSFFARFRFRFRDRSPDVLRQGLQERFYRLGGTKDGWESLIRNIQRWINYQQIPPPHGLIGLMDVRNAALWLQPTQIPQEYVVPEDYVAPEEWSERELEALLREPANDGVVVLTGSPGVGKSTYLSWLVSKYKQSQIPVVRHHYYLSSGDPTPFRAHWETAAGSLIAQLSVLNGQRMSEAGRKNPSPTGLREYLEAAGEDRNGQHPLVVIIDGLDHVWRDLGAIDELRTLLDLLLPAPKGVVVLVGTQDVESAHLPRKHQ